MTYYCLHFLGSTIPLLVVTLEEANTQTWATQQTNLVVFAEVEYLNLYLRQFHLKSKTTIENLQAVVTLRYRPRWQ